MPLTHWFADQVASIFRLMNPRPPSAYDLRIFREGKVAFRNGLRAKHNPHPKKTPEHEAWKQGWCYAATENLLNPPPPPEYDPIVFREGEEAFETGLGEKDNPYTCGTMRHRSWHAGWRRAVSAELAIW